MAQYTEVATVEEVPKGSMKAFEVGRHRLVVCNTGAGIFAVVDECSHDFEPLSGGELNGVEVICPRHGARFNVMDGRVTAPPAVAPIDTYQVKVEGGNILVLLD